jgi:hypothetical protein
MRTLVSVCFLLLVLALSLVGCASFTKSVGLCSSTTQRIPLADQTKRIEDESKARVYVLRPYNYVGCAVGYRILENRNYIGELGAGGYLCWETTPGNITLTSDTTANLGGTKWNMDLKLEPGVVYYLQAHIVAEKFLEALDPAVGERLLKKCQPPQKR